MAQRIGFYSIRQVARRMCKLIVQFTPLIQQAYPSNAALIAALAAANAACGVLVEEIDKQAPVGV